MPGGRGELRFDSWTAIGLTGRYTVGQHLGYIFEDPTTGYQYRLVRADTALINDKFAAGEVACYKTSAQASRIVTNDVSASEDGANYPKAAGLALGAVPEEAASASDANRQYLFVLGRGYYATAVIKTGEAAAVADPLRPATDTDGALIKIAGDGDIRIALAACAQTVAAQSGTSVAVDVKALGF